MPTEYIKLDKEATQVLRDVEQTFTDVQYNEFIDEEKDIRSRFRVRCVFLYATSAQKSKLC